MSLTMSNTSGKTVVSPIRWGEWNDAGVVEALRTLRLPFVFRKIWASYWRYIRGDKLYADMIEAFCEKTTKEYFALVARREAIREQWFNMWNDEGLDFVLTVPNALPAVPHGGMKYGWSGCSYSFLFNIVSRLQQCEDDLLTISRVQLDYTAGVIPVTHVDRVKDRLTAFNPRNNIERKDYLLYDADKMHGLPVGVQVVGRRLEEEKVLMGMKLLETSLKRAGKAYSLLETD